MLASSAPTPTPETGKLADAFNVMVDERDGPGKRLRLFFAEASHELRTPLTSIRGYLDVQGEGGFRDEARSMTCSAACARSCRR